MKVFLKYISHSMLEKKGRFFLMIFSIAISTALLVASSGMVDVVIDSLNAPYKSGQLADLQITSKEDYPYMEKGDFSEEGLTDIIYLLQTTGVINENDKIQYVSLQGRTGYDESIVEGTTDFLGQKETGDRPSCIISKRIADSMKLNPGDELTLYLAGQKTSFRITAVSADEGLFYNDRTEAFHLLVPYSYLNEVLGAKDGYNLVLANVAEGKAETFAESFNAANPKLNAIAPETKIIGDDSLTMGLYFMLAIVAIVSSIIIHGVFKLILTERMSVIGTFMSQGATKRKVEGIILAEGMLYGLLGGIVGCVVGEVLLFFLGRLTSPLADYGIYTPFTINPLYPVIGMVFAVLLSTISAYFPVRSVRKLQTKDVILNRVDHSRKNRWIKSLAGFLLLGFALVVYLFYKDMPPVFSILGFVIAYTGIVLLVPSVVKKMAEFLSRVCKNNTTLYLTLNNIRSERLLRNNIVLVVISLSSVLMIASFGRSMTDLVTDAYRKMNYDFSISGFMEIDPAHPTTDMVIEKLESIDGVKPDDIDTQYMAEGSVDGETAILTGVNPDTIAKTLDAYFNFTTTYAEDYRAFTESSDNAILLTTKVADKIGKGKGDTVTLKLNSLEVPFRVIGVYDGKVFNSGLSVLVKTEIFKKEFHVKEASGMFLRASGDAQALEKEIKPYLASLGCTYSTKAEDTRLNDEANQQIVMVMSVFSYLAMIIASIGIFNNIAISFIQRKRELAVMASLGMDKGKRMRLLLSESLTSVLFSIPLSICFTILFTGLMSAVSIFIGLPMVITFDWSQLPAYCLMITVIILIASISSMAKSRKLSIIRELKYE